MKYFKPLAALLVVLTLPTLACAPIKSAAENQTSPSSQYNYTETMPVKEMQRSFLIHLPTSYNKTTGTWPLVIVLHGGGGEARTMNPLTDFNALSDKEGFVIAYPEGYEHGWNDGRGDPGIKAQAANIDDVAFISAIIDQLVKELNINPKMVYATGISNGGIMTDRLGSELADKIAAIAPVAGNIPQKTITLWSPSHPISVLIINGTEDPLVPYRGGDVSFLSLKRGKVASVDDTVKFWVTNNGCSATPTTESPPHLNPSDTTSTVVQTYTGCKNGTEVILYKVIGGGHTWPGGLQYQSDLIIGKTSRDFNATQVIWQFFKAHPMH